MKIADVLKAGGRGVIATAAFRNVMVQRGDEQQPTAAEVVHQPRT